MSWYDVLLTVQDTPVVRLNRAVAVGELRGPEEGLARIDELAGIDGYPLRHVARAEMLVRLGRSDDAVSAYTAALALPLNAAQRAHLSGRLAELTGR